MPATVSVVLEGTGTLTIDGTIANNYIVVDERAVAVSVKLSDTSVGAFAIESSSSAAELDYDVWIEVWRRESAENTGSKTIYLAGSGAGKTLNYRVTG
jgi:hypothetical protein